MRGIATAHGQDDLRGERDQCRCVPSNSVGIARAPAKATGQDGTGRADRSINQLQRRDFAGAQFQGNRSVPWPDDPAIGEHVREPSPGIDIVELGGRDSV